MTKDFVTIIREENQRLRIERVGFISRIEELQAEVARLEAEVTRLRPFEQMIGELHESLKRPRASATTRAS